MKRYNRTALNRHDRTEKFKPWKSRSRVRVRAHQGRAKKRGRRS